MIDFSQPLASRARVDPSRQLKPKKIKTTQEFIDHVPPNAPESSDRSFVLSLRTTIAVIKMMNKGRNPHMHHVPRTRRVNVDISVTYVHTNQQILTI